MFLGLALFVPSAFVIPLWLIVLLKASPKKRITRNMSTELFGLDLIFIWPLILLNKLNIAGITKMNVNLNTLIFFKKKLYIYLLK